MMARPERRDAAPELMPPLPSTPGGPDTRVDDPSGHRSGGHVGRMQADLADRLVRQGTAPGSAGVTPDERAGERPDERAVRFVSALGGYLALLTAYAGTIRLILR